MSSTLRVFIIASGLIRHWLPSPTRSRNLLLSGCLIYQLVELGKLKLALIPSWLASRFEYKVARKRDENHACERRHIRYVAEKQQAPECGKYQISIIESPDDSR